MQYAIKKHFLLFVAIQNENAQRAIKKRLALMSRRNVLLREEALVRNE